MIKKIGIGRGKYVEIYIIGMYVREDLERQLKGIKKLLHGGNEEKVKMIIEEILIPKQKLTTKTNSADKGMITFTI